MELSVITIISLGVIGVMFFVYLGFELAIGSINMKIKKSIMSNGIIDNLKKTKLIEICRSYLNTITIKTGSSVRTNIPSAEYFNEASICKAINLRFVDTGASTLVGLGLLGTFLGLTIGIHGFDSSNTENIQTSIQGLLGGMGTAFSTSLLGMFLSIVLTWIDKDRRNRLSKNLYSLTEKLDEQYYIDDIALQSINQKEITNSLYTNLRELIENKFKSLESELSNKITYKNESNETVTIGNCMREVLAESQQQTKALKSFSTDLAIELNNGFDEVMSRQMKDKILPLMESVDNTTKIVIDHIDKMADTVASPASGMMHNVVEELKKSMTSITEEFRQGLSGSATSQLEGLAAQLGTASKSMSDFPKNMENISATLQVTIDEVKNAISEISNTSANANSETMQRMQEQITMATGEMSNAITQVKDVMNGITNTSQEQSKQMIDKLSEAADKMGAFLNGTVNSLAKSVTDSVKNITDDVNSKQTDLLALQEDTTGKTKELLEAFVAGLDRLEKMNEYVTGTMNGFQKAQNEINTSTGNLRTISDNMKLATELFNKSQNDYTTKIQQLQTDSMNGIDHVKELLRESGQLNKDYAEKFEIIEQGLGNIFDQLQNGLTEYSNAVKESTRKYLDQYSTSLTEVTDHLSSAISQQNEVVEMLNETLTHKR